MEPEPLTWGRLLTSWDVSPGWMIACALAVLAYAAGHRAARRRSDATAPTAPTRWLVLWVAGVVLLAVSVQSGLDRYATSLLWVHMVQHLLLIMVVPALLVMAHPLTVLEAAVPRARWRHSSGARILLHPVVGFLVYVVVIFTTHLTSFLDVSTSRSGVHVLEQLLYVGAGLMLFWPVLSDDLPHAPHYLVRIAVLFVAMMPDAVVGIVLMQSARVLAPDVATHRVGWGPEPLDDQRLAGGIMWVFGDSLMMLFVLIVVFALIAHRAQAGGAGAWLESARRASLIDSLRARGVDDSMLSDTEHLDADDAALEAYNAMLRRLDEGPGPR